MAISVTGRAPGQALLYFALLLPLVLLPAAALGGEGALLAARQARLQEVTVLAALDAAQQLDASVLRSSGAISIDRAAAAAAARADLAAAEPQASLDRVAIGPAGLALEVSERVPLRLATFVPGRAVTLAARASARLHPGMTAPG